MHSGKSIAVKQFITVINDWVKILDKGWQVDTLIWTSKMFTSHCLNELVKCKLYGYGICGKTLK